MRFQHHKVDHQAEGSLKGAFWLNLSFTVVELIGGLYTNSLAIMADALHDLGDSLSLGLAWYFQRLSGKDSNFRFTFGYRRFSLLGAILNGLILLTGSLAILWHAVPQIWSPESTDVKGMLYLSILGIGVNSLAFWRLRGGESLNQKMVGLHLLEDVLGWVAVLIGSILMLYFDWAFLDPLLSVLISLYVLYHVYRNLKKSLPIFLQAAPDQGLAEKLKAEILKHPSVQEVEDLHLWNLDEDYRVFSAHLRVSPQLSLSEGEKLKEEIRQILEEHDVDHSTLELIPKS